MENLADILIVDDLPTNLNVISNVLAPLGYSVATVTNGERALKQLQRAQPSLILLDIQMPGMDGFEVCKRIKANPNIADIPIIFLTVQSDAKSIDRGLALGAVDYIAKPFQAAELVARVKTHLKLQQVNQFLEQQVTERTQALAATTERLQMALSDCMASQERFALLFENSADAILLLNDQGYFDCNQAGLDLFGYEQKSDLCSRSLSQVSPEFQVDGQPSRHKADGMIKIAYERGSHRFEWLHQRCQGEPFWTEVVLTAIPYNGSQIIHSLIRDISDRKAAEQQLDNLIAGTAATTGQDFFPALVSHIANALDTVFAMVTQRQGDQLRTLAVWFNEELHPGLAYSYAQTPCEIMLRSGDFYCSANVQQQFPEDLLLVDLGVDSYLGIALENGDGETIGGLSVLNRGPISNPQRAKQVLSVFAARAAAELERQEASMALKTLNQSLEAQVVERTAALRNNEERLRLAMRVASQGSFDVDLRTDKAVISPEYALMLGYDPTNISTTAENWRAGLHPDDNAATQQAYRDYAAGQTSRYQAEFRMRTQQGDWKWILSTGQFIEWDEAGHPTRFLGIHTDIHKRKLAEVQLQAQYELLEQIARREPLSQVLNVLVERMEQCIEGAICLLMLRDQDNYLRYGAGVSLPAAYAEAANRVQIVEQLNLCTRAAYTKRIVMVEDFATSPLLSPDYKALAVQHGFQAGWSVPIIANDESLLGTFTIHYREPKLPQTNELDIITQMAHIAGIAIARQQADEQLRRSKANLLEAQKVAHVGNWEFDVATQTVTWSPEMFRIYGLEPAVTAPSLPEYLDMLQADDRQNLQSLIERALTQGTPYALEYRLVRPDGTMSYHECRAEIEQNSQGQVTRIFGTALDITGRKQAELALQNLIADTATTMGQDFFPALVQHLAATLQVAYASVAKQVNHHHLQMLAFWGHGKLRPIFTYEIGEPGATPCYETINQGYVSCDQSVEHDFPNDKFLSERGITSYLSVALQNIQGNNIGVLCIFDTKPIQDLPRAEQILRVFAARATAELERQQAEAQLVASENKFRSIFNHAAVGIVHASLGANHLSTELEAIGGSLLAVNPQFCKMLGYTAAELVGMSVAEVSHPEDQVAASFPRLLAGEISHFSQEKRYIRKDGTIIWVQTTVALQHGSNNKPSNTVAVIQDISERKRLEFERQKAEMALQNLIAGTARTTGQDFFPALVRYIAEALDVAYVIVAEKSKDSTDARTLAFWANGTLQTTVNYPLAGTPCAQAQETGSFYCEQQLKQQFPHATVLEGMDVDSYLGVALRDAQGDILGDLCILNSTQLSEPQQAEQILQVFAARASAEIERQRSEAALQLSEARARASFEQVAVGVAESDMQTGRLTRVNDHLCALMGYTSEELLTMGVVDLTHPEDLPVSLENIRQLSKGEQGDFSLEKRYLRKDGSEFWSETSVTLVQEPDGNSQYCLAMIWDITTRRQTEQALQNLIEGTAATTSQDFFPALVRHIAAALNVPYVLVTEKVGDSIQTLAFWSHDTLLPRHTYEIAHTPCQQVLDLGEYYCEANVQQRFPDDQNLVDLAVENYLGIALRNAQGQDIGHLFIMASQPIAGPQRAKQILRVFAARAAAELERTQAEQSLQNLIEGTATTGRDFFQALVYHLARALRVAAAFVTERVGDESYVLAFSMNDAPQPTFSYMPVNTPCEFILSEGRYYCETGVQKEFPGNAFLVDWQTEGYLGIALHGSQGEVLGTLCIFSQEPLINSERAENLMQAFAARAVAELERKQAEQALQNLITGTAATTGQDFFPALVEYMATALDVSYAIVSELVDDRLSTLAFWANGAMQRNLSYNPSLTPCELTLQKGTFYCDHGVQQQFSDAPDLVEMNAESYLGIALQDAQGRAIGDLCILNHREIPNPQRAEQILQVFAARAAAELERQRAEVAVKRQLVAIESAIDGIGILQNNTYLYANQAYRQQLGYEGSTNLVGQDWRDVYVPAEVTRFEQEILPALERDRTWRGEVMGTRQDGSTYDKELSLSLTDDDILIRVCRNVSNRKQAELALQNLIEGTAATTGQDFFSALVRHIAGTLDVAYVLVAEHIEGDLHVLAAWSEGKLQPNYSFTPMHGPCSRTLQKGFYYCPDAVQSEFPDAPALAELGAVCYLGIALYDNQGELIGILHTLSRQSLRNPQRAEQILRVFGARSAAELERQRAQTALEALNQALETKVSERTAELATSRAYYQGIISDQTELICRFLPDSTLTFVNEAYCEFFGKSSSELIGQHVFQLLPERDQRTCQENFKHLSIDNPVSTCEYQAYASDGSLRWQQWSDRALFDADGNFIEYQAVGRDITDRKRAEQALENLISGTATTGQDFFPALVRHISDALEITYVFVAAKVGEYKMDVLAFWGDGALQSTNSYDPRPMPCQEILDQGWLYCEHSIQDRFPKDEFLAKLKVQSYLGVAIYSAQGEAIGDLCIFDSGPIADPHRAMQILRVFAARAGAELERQWAKTALEQLNQSLEIKVTERTAELREREIRLKASEQRYSSLAAAAPVGIFRHNMPGECIYVNQRTSEITGLSHEALKGNQWQNALHPEDRERVINAWMQAFQTQTPFQLEYRFQWPDGTSRWVYTQAVAEFDASGQMIGSVGTITDISDRKAAEIALQNLVAGTAATGQDFFPALVEHISTALDVSYALVAEKVGSEMRVMALWGNGESMSPVSYIPVNTPCEFILRDGYYYCEHSVQAAFPGNKFLVDTQTESYLGIPLYDSLEQTIGILCIFDQQPILNPKKAENLLRVFGARAAAEVERQRAQTALEELNRSLEAKVTERTAALQASQAYYQSIVADQTELICRFSPDCTLTFVNEAYCQYFQKSSAELVGSNYLNLLLPADREGAKQALKSLSLERPVNTYEHRVVAPGTTIRWQQWTDRAFFDNEGNAFEFQSVGRDITDLKEATAQLETSNIKLEVSNKELESFAYSVSHDLRAPLRAIDGFSKALLEDYGNSFDEIANGYFGRIRKNIARMSTLIDDLLSLSRVSQAELNYVQVDLSRLAHELVSELRESAPERQVEIVIAPNMTITADVTLMRIMLTNLLQNAWKFTSYHPTARIEFGMHPPTEQAATTYFVKDDGAGFNMAYMDKLFGVFQRLHTENEFPGTGIGLATVQRIIHRHGGRVWAEAEIEQGATFFFTAP